MSGFKTIPRRTFLQGLGATMALPLLDGMQSARAAAAATSTAYASGSLPPAARGRCRR